MKKNTLLALLIVLTVFSCKNEPEKKTQPLTMGQLTISDEYPQPGDQIDLVYNNNQDADAFFEYMVGDKSYPQDIDFKNDNGEQKASIKIPDSAVALAFVIKADDTFDHNDKQGYIMPLYDNEGNVLAGSKAASAYYKVRNGQNYGIVADETEGAQIIKSELDANQDLKKNWDAPYIQMVYKNNKDEGRQLMNQYGQAVTANPNATQKEYENALQFYSLLEDEDKYEDLKKQAIAKYPNGSTANYDLVEKFQQESSLENKVATFKTFAASNKKLGNLGNYMAGTIAQMYYQQNDMENFNAYLDKMDDKQRKASALNNLAWPLAESGENLEQAEKMSKKSLDLIASLQKNNDEKPDYFSAKQFQKNLEYNYRSYADTYANILFKEGKIKEAISYQEKALDPKGSMVDINQRYIEYLMADNQYETVAEKAENFIRSGNSNSEIKEAYKTAYVKTNPSATDVDSKLKDFEKEAYDFQLSKVKKTMLNEEAPGFSLKDSKGNMVALEDLKGKTVILDFWATWCGPCKASFPGMQEVVTKYKNDDKVVLLFVDTFERGDTREKMVEDFIKTNKYDFHVVYDQQIEGSNDFEVASKYGITGIPTKVIIGPDGKMKFKSVGYNGSNEKLVQEMDIMIDILKS